MPNSKHKFDESTENYLGKLIVDDEYQTAKSAKNIEIADFESVIDMLECKHTERDYEWMSDIEYPLLASILITDASGWANQYFQTRDFVEPKLEGLDPNDKKKCAAAKKCINQTLNNRNLFHYHKYIRGRTINSLGGIVYALCWWEQKVTPKITGYNNRTEELGVDIYGNQITNPDQEPATRNVQEPIYDEDIQVDRFNYEIVDPRNVYTDGKYVYSPQEKDWITIRSETTYDELKAKEKEKGYFNLDIVKELRAPVQTETAKETYENVEQSKKSSKSVIEPFDKLLRFGKIRAVVSGKDRDEEGYPTKITPGYDTNGNELPNSQLVESIMEFVIDGNHKVLIRFQPNPYRDTRGNSYKPIVRGLCYIHPTKDIGLGDGKYLREMQVATSDHFNMGSDRVKLATLPTLQGRKWALEDNTTIYFEPQHIMEVEEPGKDLVEFKISDNIDGTINMINMLQNEAYKLTASQPSPAMGMLPEKASTTATAVAGAATKTSERANYKSLTFEYTFLLDFYWMILQMTYAFARPKTALKMMGKDNAPYFDPDAEYSYSPVSSNIEVEFNKHRKLQIIDQFIGRLVKIPNPNIWKMLNYLLRKAFELFGDDFPDYKDILLDEKAPPPEQKGKPGEGQVGNIMPTPATNQTEIPQSEQEQFTRGEKI